MITNIIEVLRKPRAPNTFYHKQCYTSQEHHKDDVVLEVLRLIKNEQCIRCGVIIAKGALYDRDEDEEDAVIAQIALFDMEGVA